MNRPSAAFRLLVRRASRLSSSFSARDRTSLSSHSAKRMTCASLSDVLTMRSRLPGVPAMNSIWGTDAKKDSCNKVSFSRNVKKKNGMKRKKGGRRARESKKLAKSKESARERVRRPC